MSSPLEKEVLQLEPVLHSVYVSMPDGVRLAVDSWLPSESGNQGDLPALLLSTRYWRSFELSDDKLSYQGIYSLACYFVSRGVAVINVDSRGSGASFGSRRTEWSEAEVIDMEAVIEWIICQPWSNGRVASHGFSYGGNTAFLAAVCNHPALTVLAPQFADFDIYQHNTYPGGLANRWLKKAWGKMTTAMDCADIPALSKLLPGVDDVSFRRLVKGPRPVTDDQSGALLSDALVQHKENYNLEKCSSLDEFIDGPAEQIAGAVGWLDTQKLSIYSWKKAIEYSGVPIVYWAGWFDAGTAEGALNLFATFSNPKRIFIGPWNHGRHYFQDPLSAQEMPEKIPQNENFADIFKEVAPYLFDGNRVAPQNSIFYYTLGQGRWKSSACWPPAGVSFTRLYFAEQHRLSEQQPVAVTDFDTYTVDESTSTGQHNRWHTQIGCLPVYHEDRAEQDKKLLIYDSHILPEPIEITGHPRLSLTVASDRPDGSYFVYLEIVAPDGVVKLATEGCLRAINRKLTQSHTDFVQFGPSHSFLKADKSPLPSGEFVRLEITLLPLSLLVPAGYRLRVALAGADCDTFAQVEGCSEASWRIGRNKERPSYLELPLVTGGR